MKSRKRVISVRLTILAVTIGATLLCSIANSAEGTLKKITVGYASFVPSTLWFWLEKDLGYFRAEGLRPEFVHVRNSGIAMKGMIAGNFDYITPTGSVMDAVVRARQPFKLLFTALRVHYSLIAQPEIRSVADLRGKTIGIASIGSSNDLIMREILRRHGLDPLKDTALLAISSASRDRFAALTSGAIHATFLSTPFDFKAVEMGYRRLVKAIDYVNWPQAGLAANEVKVHREPQEIAKMVRASLKGLRFVLTHPEYILSKIMQIFRLAREDAVHVYEALLEEYVPSGYLTEQEQRAAISIIKQAANVTEEIPAERVFDYRFVKQAEQELNSWVPKAPR
jgi:NitT/TauT family transport system substrate-binding protein